MLVKLYWYRTTNPQKVRWALDELGVDYELIEIDLFKGAHRTPEFAEINPLQAVPVWVDDELVIRQSNAILVHLGAEHGALWPTDRAGITNAHEWLAYEASDLQPHAGTLWFGETIKPRFGGAMSEEQRQRAKSRLRVHFSYLDGVLAGRPYLLEEFSLVDCAIGIWLLALEATSFDDAPYAHVRRYRAALKSRPAVAAGDIRFLP